ncbi:MAG: hypothetical protein A2W01_07290 [Candidatus Solincola sediminis]|uniref:RNA polymerase sigma-70 domain-containing protein n=1 Tax=Candidatus Solincola sediminis TaxID=1797199 RepID=A0A1F2WRP6_9ACTN|nr:MAG: hypothetical protein A2Y75_11550 [Candidatus Solincola sediminis]OFW59930.1 MAG: hypothetical protein A2W01_07290 [Candidatus Solincola sediminis]
MLVASDSKQQARRQLTKELFLKLKESRDYGIRDQLISLNIDLVDYLARRFMNRGEPLEDLLQVGYIGLIKSVDRYDIDRGLEFSTYATPTIIGELKRYLRDKGWTIRIPRRLQIKGFELNQAVDDLTQELQRPPTVQEIAQRLNANVEEIIETIESGLAINCLSLDTVYSKDDEQVFCLIDFLGDGNDDYSLAEDREAIANLLSRLSEREQKVVYMRFFVGMTQVEIARALDISQMHVSRLIGRTINKLRSDEQLEEIFS